VKKRGRQVTKRRALPVTVAEQADGIIDLDAWVRRYVAEVAELDGWTVQEPLAGVA